MKNNDKEQETLFSTGMVNTMQRAYGRKGNKSKQYWSLGGENRGHVINLPCFYKWEKAGFRNYEWYNEHEVLYDEVIY